MTVILDASAMLALIFNERGAESVIPYARGSQLLAINFSEVVARVLDIDGNSVRAEAAADRLEIEIIPFNRALARATALLKSRTASIGASLADRSCLAFAMTTKLPVLTADKRWSELDLGLDIRQIR